MSHVHTGSAAGAYQGRLVIVLLLALAVLVLQFVGGLVTNSLALLADAGHVLTDAGGVALALFAIWLGGRPATIARTYGLYRVEIMAAALNAVALFAIAGFVLYEAWGRLSSEPEIQSGPMLVIAALGLAANVVSMLVLRNAQEHSLNMRGAYLEVMADTLGSIAVIGAAVVIGLTGFTQADAIASGIIGLLIVPRTWSLLRQATDVLLEASPRGVDMEEVRRHILETPGVGGVHDLHAWTITSGMNVVSAHIVIEDDARSGAVLDQLSSCLSGDFDISHSTFQLEPQDRQPLETAAHR